MNIRFFLFICLVFSFTSSSAQWVKEDDTTTIWLDAGIYLSDSSFFSNQPDLQWAKFENNWRTKDSLERKRILVGIELPDYYNGNIRLSVRQAYGTDSLGDSKIVSLNSVFAIVVFGTPYLHIKEARHENFIKVTMQGVVSYVQYHREIPSPFSVTAAGVFNDPQETTEFVEKIVDFEKGVLIRKTKKNLEKILQRDPVLFNEYLVGRQNYTNLMGFVKAYNQSHELNLKY